LCDKQWPILNQFLSSALSTLLLLYIHLLHGLQLRNVESAPIDIQTVSQGIRGAVDWYGTRRTYHPNDCGSY
jgi:hypothetical protein